MQDGIGFAAVGFGPVNGAAVEVARIEQGHRAALRLRADGVPEPEINHRPGGDGQAQGGEAGVEAAHHLRGDGLVCRRGNVDELFRVARVNDFREGDYFFGDDVAVLTAAAGNNQFRRLVAAFDGVKNDIFLQDLVAPKGGVARFKNVEPLNFQIGQKILPESPEVRTVAEASGGNAHELAARNQQAVDERDEAGVKIACFHAGQPQAAALGGVRADLPIRRIYNRGIEGGRLDGKQIIGEAIRHFPDEVGRMNGEAELDAGPVTAFLARLQRVREGSLNPRVQFVQRRLDRADAGVSITQAGNESRGESPRTGSGIQQADRLGKRAEQRGHKVGDGSRREELPQLPLALPRGGFACGDRCHVVRVANWARFRNGTTGGRRAPKLGWFGCGHDVGVDSPAWG